MDEHNHDCPVCAKRQARELAELDAASSKAVLNCIKLAECMNRLRIVPRLMLIAYGFICWETFKWFTGLGPEATTQHVTFASTIWGAAAAWFGLYVNSGNKTFQSGATSAQATIKEPPGGFGGGPGGYGQG